MKVLALHVKLGVQSAPESAPGSAPDLVYTPKQQSNLFLLFVLKICEAIVVSCGLLFY